MKYQTLIDKFWQLQATGKSACIDINMKTGEMLCRYTISNNAARVEGAGTPPQIMSDDWYRIVECQKGEVMDPDYFID